MSSRKNHLLPKVVYFILAIVVIVIISVTFYSFGKRYSAPASQDDANAMNDASTPSMIHTKYLPNQKGYLHQ